MANVPASVEKLHLRSIVLDCRDAVSLARFYAALLDAVAETSNPAWCTVELGSPPRLAFQRLENYEPPRWPDGSPQQVHLDIAVEDLEQASKRAVELGATVLGGPIIEPECTFIVHQDPAGHPFCLCLGASTC